MAPILCREIKASQSEPRNNQPANQSQGTNNQQIRTKEQPTSQSKPRNNQPANQNQGTTNQPIRTKEPPTKEPTSHASRGLRWKWLVRKACLIYLFTSTVHYYIFHKSIIFLSSFTADCSCANESVCSMSFYMDLVPTFHLLIILHCQKNNPDKYSIKIRHFKIRVCVVL